MVRTYWRGLSEGLKRFYRFALHDIWQIGTPGEQIPRGLVIKQIRVAILLGSKLIDGMHMVRAASLAFATLLSIVPFLAMLFFVIQEFNLSDSVYRLIKDRMVTAAERFAGDEIEEASPAIADEPSFADVPEAGGYDLDVASAEDSVTALPAAVVEPEDESSELQRQVIDFVFQGITNSDEGAKDPVEAISNAADTIAQLATDAANNRTALFTSGIILIITAVFGTMRNVENAFNRIWGVRRSKSWYRTFADYLMVLLAMPFVVAAAMGVLIALRSEEVSQILGPAAVALGLGQQALIIVVFTLLYKFVPHTRVQFRYALLAGFIAGTLWSLLSFGYVQFQFGMARYAVILSAFAQFPMLLMWIYFSWAIVLLGCEIAFAYQNERTFALERYASEASFAYTEAVGLRTMVDIAYRFDRGLPGFTAEGAARDWNVPIRLLCGVLESLSAAGFVSGRTTEPVEYQPARPLDRIRAADVLHALRVTGTEPSRFREDPRLRKMFNELERSQGDFAGATFEDLVPAYSEAVERAPEPSETMNV
jgi:membrane protein